MKIRLKRVFYIENIGKMIFNAENIEKTIVDEENIGKNIETCYVDVFICYEIKIECFIDCFISNNCFRMFLNISQCFPILNILKR